MKLVLITVTGKRYDSEVRGVILPGCDGEFSVWDFHQPFLYRLGPGAVGIIERGKRSFSPSLFITIKRGLARMRGNTLTVLAEQ